MLMSKNKNEKFLAVIVIALIAIIVLQVAQLFAIGQTSRTTARTTGMASGSGMAGGNGMSQGEFSSVEEMMATHHGTESGSVGGCGGH